MKLEFTWAESLAGPQAVCNADGKGSNGVCPLACLLMDDGGLDASASLAWLRAGIARVDEVLCGASGGRTDWDREAWGAAVGRLETNVHSLHDEECAEVVSTSAFRLALAEWMKFVEAGKGSRAVTVDLS